MSWSIYTTDYDGECDPRDVLASQSNNVGRGIDVEDVEGELGGVFAVLESFGLSQLTKYEIEGSEVYSAVYDGGVKLVADEEASEKISEELGELKREIEVEL